MTNEINGKNIAQNITLSIMVQIVSVSVGFIINLIVPKFIDEYQYSFWQTFLLYSQYMGMLHFGLLDGIVLRYSQYSYEDLDKKAVRSQYIAIIGIDILLAFGMLITALVFLDEVTKVLCVLLAFVMISGITHSYVSHTFQITNRIKEYAWHITIYRSIYCALVVLCLALNLKQYYWYCIAYIFAYILGVLLVGMRYSRDLFFGPLIPLNNLKIQLNATISSGIWLMVASYSANLVIGFGKMIVQWRWDILTFGKVSLAYSLTSFILQFVTATSIVLFPSLKRLDSRKLPEMYISIRNLLSPLLIFLLILFYPGSLILELWLPKYAESLIYFGILMPIIIFTSKVSLLTNNYLKAYREERMLLLINIVTVACSLIIFLIIAYVFNNLIALLVAVVITIMLRSFVSEIVVMKIIGIRAFTDFIFEFIMSTIFIISTICLRRWAGCVLYSVALCVYFILKRKSFFLLSKQVSQIFKKSAN